MMHNIDSTSKTIKLVIWSNIILSTKYCAVRLSKVLLLVEGDIIEQRDSPLTIKKSCLHMDKSIFNTKLTHLLHHLIANTVLDGWRLCCAFISFYSLGNNPQLHKLE